MTDVDRWRADGKQLWRWLLAVWSAAGLSTLVRLNVPTGVIWPVPFALAGVVSCLTLSLITRADPVRDVADLLRDLLIIRRNARAV